MPQMSVSDMLARVFFENYNDLRRKQGKPVEYEAFDDQPEDLAQSCYDKALDLANKIESLDCVAVPLSSDVARHRIREFSPEQVERIARLEHQRWVEERKAAGWTHAETKDVDAKESPFIVDFDELPDDVKEFDYAHVREIIELHESAGYAIVPREAVDGASRALERELEDAEYAAEHDPLTGALNMRGGKKAARAAFADFLRGEPCTVAMLDIDKFKHFNDTYGHHMGDEVLKAVARAMQQAFGDGAHVIRQGGDEFSLLLPGVGEEGAEALAGRLMDVAERLEAKSDDQRVAICISVGLDWLTAADQAEPGEEWGAAQEAFARADAKMYEAKEATGNSVVY